MDCLDKLKQELRTEVKTAKGEYEEALQKWIDAGRFDQYLLQDMSHKQGLYLGLDKALTKLLCSDVDLLLADH